MSNKIFDFFRSSRAPKEMVGRIPPQAPEMEQAILGVMINNAKKNFIRVNAILSKEMFTRMDHVLIWESLEEMYADGKPIDLLTLMRHMSGKEDLGKVGGIKYLTELDSKVVSDAHVEYHAKIIAQQYMKREMIRIGEAMVANGYDETVDVFELLDASKSQIDGLVMGIDADGSSLADMVPAVVSDIERAKNGEMVAMTAGFEELENLVMQVGDLVIVAGRPGMGKTALALAMAVKMSLRHGAPVLYNSLEMDGKRLTQRLLATEHRLHTRQLITGGGITVDHVARFYDYGDRNLKKVFYHKCRTVSSLKAAIHRHRSKHRMLPTDPLVVMVDYLQLMTGSRTDSREQEVASLSRGLKELATDENCVMIALSQLSRSVEQRGGEKKPMLSDLRDSGSIEQDADTVIFAYRPEYYGFMQDESGMSTAGVGILIEAKNRIGIVHGGEYRLGFVGGAWVSSSDSRMTSVSDFPDPRRVQPKQADEDYTDPF